ncbi:hypothetical protein CWI38_1523p0010 [Hamiltosporidium tvaerminnensis]|uniref:Uncharacterized protein n=2 Tax=Hamiltosporidium TaxID=1176354 RepID=A0A4Q9LD08_9MICR|nr:hypothetical protein LUQ84_002613 [Hamiltosporidium tvaerminnensis]TBU01429.1 hypothetical protein CWI37_0711p0010 [Hamiltosporidium tvaerminnensis]TBU03992.1 hypothetical protein CWI36_0829p0050 [Hamiltosporidium magnivora]TBU05777.1 hypothetical protein CWI39_0623p0010 [Hamiltosporidium magnivora]TBU10831.1 hypothetical protein CWI38_1523p0010 [Hamiltosporidium tvaerminnensis]
MFLFISWVSCGLTQIFLNRLNKFSEYDPGMLLVNVDMPDYALKIFDFNILTSKELPVAMAKLKEEDLPYMILHSYYEGNSKNFWLEMDNQYGIKISLSGNLLQASRFDIGGKSKLIAAKVLGTKNVLLMHNNQCLTVDAEQSKYREGYPIRLKKCKRDEPKQLFRFVSALKGACVLNMPVCPGLEILTDVERVIEHRISHFAI